MPQEPTERETSLREVRLGKLARLREIGLDPYAVERFATPETAAHLVGEGFEENRDVSFAGRLVSYRLMGKAGFGHLSDGESRIQAYFRRDDLSPEGWEAYGLLDLGDHVGVEGYLFTTKTGERSIHVRTITPLSKALHALPIGKEKDGETFSGLTDPELRFRHRHLDLIANKDARDTLLNRARIVSAVRRYFDSLGYLEVETPLLQLEAGGAAARPFTTHYNAYDIDVKLRISLELYLKRLICGDVPKVYEVGRVFRNEGLSSRHNPEFTLLEFYESYVDLETMMERVEGCFRSVIETVYESHDAFRGHQVATKLGLRSIHDLEDAQHLGFVTAFPADPTDADFVLADRRGVQLGDEINVRTHAYKLVLVDGQVDVAHGANGREWLIIGPRGATIEQYFAGNHPPLSEELQPATLEIAHPNGDPSHPLWIDFKGPWKRVDLLTAIHERSGVPREALRTLDTAKAYLGANPLTNPANGKTIDPSEERNLGGLIEKLLEVFVEPTLQEPTFVVGYPIETSPLAKKDPNRTGFTRRFEGYVLGREVCNAFSEINDPVDQRERFEQQAREAAKGDDEAHPTDEEFLFALESGMPPTGGCGIGLDRMAMLLTGASSIREVLMFPMMKPEASHTASAGEA